MKKLNTIALILALITLINFNLKAQSEVVVSGSRGSGAAVSNKIFKKVILLIDEETKLPIAGHHFSYAKNGTVTGSGLTNKDGYGVLNFTMNNYYAKVEINFNDNKYMRPEWLERRNKIVYKPLNNFVSFPSKKDVIDTVKFYVKKS